MKIALAIMNAEPERGGAERYTLDLASALVAHGHEVYLLAARFARNVEPARQVRLAGAAGSRTGRYLKYIDALEKHLKSTPYDIVHAMLPVRNCDLYHPHAGIEAFNLKQGHLRHASPVRQAITRLTNQLNRKRRVYAQVEKRLLENKHARLLCLSRAMRQIAEKHYTLQNAQVQVLINGVDLRKYDPLAQVAAREKTRKHFDMAPGDVVALLMANNYRLKGLRQAIQTLAELGSKKAKLLVVGRESVERYRRLAERLGVAERVVFAGPTTDPAAFYAASDLFILPTAYDSCSLVVLEALAMGKPIITTKQNGACEAIADGVEGYVIADQADLSGLHQAWLSLLDDAQRRKMSEAALQLRPELSKERHIDKLLATYAATSTYKETR